VGALEKYKREPILLSQSLSPPLLYLGLLDGLDLIYVGNLNILGQETLNNVFESFLALLWFFQVCGGHGGPTTFVSSCTLVLALFEEHYGSL